MKIPTTKTGWTAELKVHKTITLRRPGQEIGLLLNIDEAKDVVKTLRFAIKTLKEM